MHIIDAHHPLAAGLKKIGDFQIFCAIIYPSRGAFKRGPGPQHPLQTPKPTLMASSDFFRPTFEAAQSLRADAEGYLVRKADHLERLTATGKPCVGDFGLYAANPLTAAWYRQRWGLEGVTASDDLAAQQLLPPSCSCASLSGPWPNLRH